MDPLSILTGLFNEGAAIKTMEQIVSDLFAGATNSASGALLHGLNRQVDGALGTSGSREMARAITKNLDESMEAANVPVEQRKAAGKALGQNVAVAAVTYAALVTQYTDLQAAVEDAKAAGDKAALQAARAARDTAAGNLKVALGDLIRASAGVAPQAVAPVQPQVAGAPAP